jgi:ribosomal-protein-alanine N-acetyltransferase
MYQLDRICFEPPFRFTRATMHHFASEEGAFTLLAEDAAAQLAAFIIIQIEYIDPRHQAYIVTLDVAPAHRRQGLAQRLMAAAEEQAAAKGASLISLHVWTENAPAIAFYERSGYERILFHPNLYAFKKDGYGYLKSLASVPNPAQQKE